LPMSSRSDAAISSAPPLQSGLSSQRDVRLDFFRGLALWLIFLDHIPSNLVSWITIRNYGFSDATEIFIFISGYTASLVYGRTMRESGFIVAGARILRRTWQIYVAHVFLFAGYIAQVSYLASAYDVPMFAKKAQIMSFFQHPDIAIVQALILNFKPVNLDVLPVYIVLLLAFAPILWLLRLAPFVVLAASAALYTLVWIFGLEIPAYPDGTWYFNPLAWQLIFVLGAWCAAGGAERLQKITRSSITIALAAVYLASAFALAMTWHSAWFAGLEPDWLKQLVIEHPIDKSNLHILRLLHFLALAVVVLRLVPPDWPTWKSPVLRPFVLCGRHSLEIFCLGVFLAFAGRVAVVEISDTVAMQVLISATGIATMIALAELITWYEAIDERGRGDAEVRMVT
jgi:hypothetical protein